MRTLQPCHSRVEIPGGGDSYFCSHPQVFSRNGRVSSSVCRVCAFKQDPPPANPRPVPRHFRTLCDLDSCLFLGPKSEADPQSYQCRHPSHQLTTQEYCHRCDDADYPLGPGPGAVCTWAVGVTTAPRGNSTLSRMLTSLADAGWPDAYIFAEPDSPNEGLRPGDRWCPRGIKLGAFSNWYLSLTELVLREPDADAYFLCQDDVVFCRGLRDYLEQILWPNPSPQVLSTYCAAVQDRGETFGFQELDEGWQTCGALSLIFPNGVARALLCDSTFLHHRRNGPLKGMVSIDAVVGSWCRKSAITYFVHSPSLTQHIGEQSSLWGHLGLSPRRSASSFPGELTSALDYLGRLQNVL